MSEQLPEIWRTVAPLKKYRARAAMEAARRRTTDGLCFRLPCIPHAVAFMVMAPAFHTEDPVGVEDVLHIFLFLDLSPLAGSEAALLTQKWDAILGCGTLTSFADTILLMGNQKIAPVAGLDEVSFQLEDWAFFCTMFLRDDWVHLSNYKMFLLLEETAGVSPRLMVQARQQPTFPAALLCLIQ